MNDPSSPLTPPEADAADAAPAASLTQAPDAASVQAAEWERMVRIRGARHAGPSARRKDDERPR